MSLAATRLTKTRKPLIIGLHQELQRNQCEFVEHLLPELAKQRVLYSDHFDTYTDKYTMLRDHHADLHEKRALRIVANQELHENGLFALNHDTWLRGRDREHVFCIWKLKLMEWAKTGKLPRAIVDLGVSASLAGFMLMEYLKVAQSEVPIHYKGGVMYFCKSPKRVGLMKYFNELYALPWRYMFVYFSDDSVLGYWQGGVRIYHCIDISSCDASHTAATFRHLRATLPDWLLYDFICVQAQCEAPLKIKSTYDKKKKVVLRPLGPKGYSGAVLITAINNCGSCAIAYAIADNLEINPACIIPSAARAGYIVTGNEPVLFEQLQFLKHSPVKVGDHYVPMLNLGVFFRLLGTCKNDLPGNGDLRARAIEFNAGLVRSAYPRASFTMANLMRQQYVNIKVRPEIQDHIDQLLMHRLDDEPDQEWVHFDDEEIAKRYDVPVANFVYTSKLIGNLGFGDHYSDEVTDTILKLDYEMDVNGVSEPTWAGGTYEPKAVR